MIYGERIRLRASERDDLPRFVSWLNDRDVRHFLLLNLPMSLVQEEHWFENMQSRPATEHVMVIEVQMGQDWMPIGNTSFMDIDWINRSAEVGIFIGEKSCWSQGYGRETLLLMLKHGFETLNLHRIYLRVFEHNMRGIKSYENAGFKHEGRMRQARYQDGKYYDILLMSYLRDEWINEKQTVE